MYFFESIQLPYIPYKRHKKHFSLWLPNEYLLFEEIFEHVEKWDMVSEKVFLYPGHGVAGSSWSR